MTLGVRDIQSDSDLDQSSYLSQISQTIFVEKKLSCGEILGDFATIYALSCGEKSSPKVNLWRKNDKYEVWIVVMMMIVWTNLITTLVEMMTMFVVPWCWWWLPFPIIVHDEDEDENDHAPHYDACWERTSRKIFSHIGDSGAPRTCRHKNMVGGNKTKTIIQLTRTEAYLQLFAWMYFYRTNSLITISPCHSIYVNRV